MSCFLRNWLLGKDHAQKALDLKRQVRQSVHDMRNRAQVAVGASERSIRVSNRAASVAAAAIARIEETRLSPSDDDKS